MLFGKQIIGLLGDCGDGGRYNDDEAVGRWRGLKDLYLLARIAKGTISDIMVGLILGLGSSVVLIYVTLTFRCRAGHPVIFQVTTCSKGQRSLF